MLTKKGLRKIKRFKGKKLGSHARLMVVFDIPEDQRRKRTKLRLLLQELSFKPIQRSVWESEYDYREYLKSEINDLELKDHVIVYESVKIIL